MAFEFIWSESKGTLHTRGTIFNTATERMQEAGACPWSGASLAVISDYCLEARQTPLG